MHCLVSISISVVIEVTGTRFPVYTAGKKVAVSKDSNLEAGFKH